MSNNIRKTKKAMKKSSGFFTLFVGGRKCVYISEWNEISYHKKGISIDNTDYVPYIIIRKVIIKKNN